MNKGKGGGTLNYRRKDAVKRVRTIAQIVILVVLATLLARAMFDMKHYQEPDKAQWTNGNGFIALTYFGVSRSGTPDLIAKKQLDQQLKALRDQGYVTVSQQDILDFYNEGKPLPDKALFLAFEDGRNDSSLFAQPILEKNNFKATILSYANKAGSKDSKFLQPKDMLKMTKNGFWELGSNGYRLTYINIFNKDGSFAGMLDEAEFKDREKTLSYTHYLMDFLRDKNNVPVEHRTEMEARVNKDYAMMKEIYNRTLGFVPQTYMIMHANSLHHGMNRLVEDVNASNIQALFKLHFNREGNAYNDNSQSLYDLTRVQAQPYWYTNHLLMKLQKDTGQPMKFVTGDKKRAEKWLTLSGAPQYIDNRIVLTSPPAGRGMLVLKNSDSYTDMKLTAKLAGNVVGKQSVYLRYDRQRNAYVRLTLTDNELVVEQKSPDGQAEQIAFREFSDIGKNGAGSYPVNIKQTRDIEMMVQGDRLTVKADGSLLVDNQPVNRVIASGGVALESEYSDKNPKDDIYDGVFDDVKVVSAEGESGSGPRLYDNSLNGFSWLYSKVKGGINDSIDWAIDTF
ncbi:polysaccharide deacetylase family protein [Paenibacillus mendelii]|uniref:Polysaccharide deacetylase family protein n=1 Tax=Paenibacillus mendelii TaxID=206163 RepID=A0ABV6JKL2_9BACL|nr:polysaccharide deacetylase family protein [Paenibacillus mendelii]MCQ6563037.1 polysaccharide deacetylase family protein [Paenibacillus mendelii]